ncbi:MAG TPA: hypothetical protein PKA04_06125 [Marmoricola sp.]|nr:hypothetical protein [Marmoricola sp.]
MFANARWHWQARGVALLVALGIIAVFGFESRTTALLIFLLMVGFAGFERPWRRRTLLENASRRA